MKIRHAFVSSALGAYKDRFLRKYGLEPYDGPGKPSLFFGCYPGNRPDIDIASRHEALAVIVWGGSDAMNAGSRRYSRLLRRSNVRHIAISKFVSHDLMQLGLGHWYLHVTPSEFGLFKPEPLGPRIYVYSRHGGEGIYGESMIKRLKLRIPRIDIMFRYSRPPNHTPPEEMAKDYARCFMGIRLTRHDGLSNTVIELGLMGRRCVWNGWLSNSIPWRSLDDIEAAVLEEEKKVGLTFPEIADEMRAELELPGNWLTTEFYGG